MRLFSAMVRADIERCLNDRHASPLQILGALRRELGLQALLVYRFGRMLVAGRRRLLAWPLLPLGWPLYGAAVFMVRRCYDIHLGLSADIGPACLIRHFGGIVAINCRLGARCSFGQQTRIGRAEELRGPQIGVGVWIGAHAHVWGDIRIADGATVAPGAKLSRSVPANALVVGDPARVVLRYDNSPILPAHLTLERPSEPQSAAVR
jgi:serine O-acetyltransferase